MTRPSKPCVVTVARSRIRGASRSHACAECVDAPYGTGNWALYDLERDPAESTDVSAEHADVAAELRGQWDAYVERVGVVLPTDNLGP